MRSIRALSPQAAAKAQPVVLRGVVLVHSGWKNSFFFSDGSYGIAINRSSLSPVLHDGQRVTIHGVTEPGSFAPAVIANAIEGKGTAPVPHSRLFNPEELIGGRQDSQWIAVRGTVRSQQVRSVWGNDVLNLNLDVGSGVIVAVRIINFEATHLPALTGAYIQIAGVCGTLFNDRRQFIGVRLFASSVAAVKVLRPAPKDPFDKPLRPLDGLLQFQSFDHANELLRVTGTVTWNKPGAAFYLQSEGRGLFVDSKEVNTPPVGSSVDAVGYATAGHGTTRLEAAFLQQIPNGERIHPLPVAAARVIGTRDGFTHTPSEGLLIQVDGRLVDSVAGAQNSTLLLEDGDTLFSVRVTAKEAERFSPGAVLRITGVCVIDYDDYTNEPNAFSIQIRSSADISELHPAPWWNVHHALVVAEILAFVVAVLLTVILLSRQAALRSLATTDSLTGLCNRRTLLRAFESARRAGQRTGFALQLLFIDVDHFKEINDRYGHRQGDLALKRIAQLLRDAFSESRAIGRIGGDEFVVILQGLSGNSAETRLKVALARSNAVSTNPIPLSLSTGMVECGPNERTMTVEDLLERADLLMYQQKRALHKEVAVHPRTPTAAASRTTCTVPTSV